MVETVLAIALICGPPNKEFPARDYRLISAPLLTVAVALGVEEKHAEGSPAWYCSYEHIFETIQTWRERLRYPHLSELARFPPAKVVEAATGHSGDYLVACMARMAVDVLNRDRLEADIAAGEAAAMAWWHLHAAQSSSYSDTYRREALHNLRRLIGDDAFYRGQMPHVLPLDRLPTVTP